MTSPRNTSSMRGAGGSFALLLLSALLPAASAQDLRTCEQNLLEGRADQAIADLRSTLAHDPGNGDAHLLLCRAFLSELRGDDAAEQCRLALRSGLEANSAAEDWAGRAFGMQAEHAGPIAGLKLAGQVRTAFLSAHRLDPGNPAAANDLGEYYINAPSLVGGGLGKASSLADELQSTLPGIAHRLRALAAEKGGDFAGAEREFTAAAQLTREPGAFVDLSCFYVRRALPDKAAAAANRAVALDRAIDANVVDAANSLYDVHQTEQAVQTLRSYIDRGQKSDGAPAFRAHTLLGDIFASRGDKADARKEFETALNLASGYAPAQKGLASL